MQSSLMQFEFGNVRYLHSMSNKKKTILLLHAFHSSAASYLQVCDLLKDQFNVVCLDFQGHGLSARVNVEQYAWYYSMEGFAAVLFEFINHLQLKNLFIVGDSVGGNSAVRVMSSLEMLEGLILMGSAQAESVEKLFGLHYSTGPINFLFQKELTQQECEALAAAYVDPSKNAGNSFKQMLHDIQQTDPNCREQFARHLQTQAWVNELELVQKCTLPLMYILGKEDGFINSVYYKKVLLEAGLKESQIHLLDQVRHVPQLDNPPLCAQLISEFCLTSFA